MLLGDAKPHGTGDFLTPYGVGIGAAVVMLGFSSAVRRRARATVAATT
jgi:hypothetical protein